MPTPLADWSQWSRPLTPEALAAALAARPAPVATPTNAAGPAAQQAMAAALAGNRGANVDSREPGGASVTSLGLPGVKSAIGAGMLNPALGAAIGLPAAVASLTGQSYGVLGPTNPQIGTPEFAATVNAGRDAAAATQKEKELAALADAVDRARSTQTSAANRSAQDAAAAAGKSTSASRAAAQRSAQRQASRNRDAGGGANAGSSGPGGGGHDQPGRGPDTR